MWIFSQKSTEFKNWTQAFTYFFSSFFPHLSERDKKCSIINEKKLLSRNLRANIKREILAKVACQNIPLTNARQTLSAPECLRQRKGTQRSVKREWNNVNDNNEEYHNAENDNIENDDCYNANEK